jgi:uncharacterized NAD(P)/FAD-binding protein YdhS
MPATRICIIGGGPAALFVYKRIVESGSLDFDVTIFEKQDKLGVGMPYSDAGANDEHLTNVSDTELPEIVMPMKEWLEGSPGIAQQFHIDPGNFNEYKVVPRLLLGAYLEHQFELLIKQGRKAKLQTKICLNTAITDIIDLPDKNQIRVVTQEEENFVFDTVIICTGHHWPKKHEGKIPNWFDSPYPPSKLRLKANYPVAIKGSSLSAIDVLRTIAREHGRFVEKENGLMLYQADPAYPQFRLIMHSLHGLLPAIRFHTDDSMPVKDRLISEEEVLEIKAANEGFVPLDYVFDRHFRQPLQERDPAFYEHIKDMRMEAFVDHMMELREKTEAFILFKAEYREAEKSIRREQSIHWKELLSELSYAMNYPAKHFCAEDMIRLKKKLMPLIAIVIASVPQSSAREMIALHDAGLLQLVAVDEDSTITPVEEGGCLYRYKDTSGRQQEIRYELFIDAVGQQHFMFGEFPFEGLKTGTITPAHVRFRSAEAAKKEKEKGNDFVVNDEHDHYYLKVPGIQINDHYQVMDRYGVSNPRVYILAVPHIGGLNPDYSGLDFCEAASERVVNAIIEKTNESLQS